MRCAIAKTNPVLIDLAAVHYLDKAKRTEAPVFTFKSLYSDDEPYSLAELLQCYEERIALLRAEFQAYPTDSMAEVIDKHKRKYRQLVNIQEKMNGST